MKTRDNNDVTNHIGLLYAKTKIELSEPKWRGMIYDEN